MTTVCLTPDDAYAAGQQAAAALPPLTRDQTIRIALLLSSQSKGKTCTAA